VKYNLWLAAQLGLGDYASHVAQLTSTYGSGSPGSPPSVSDLSSTQQADNAYYGSLMESNSIRQYRARTSSVAFASNAAALNDVLIVDRTGYWARDASGIPTARSFHSKIFITPDDGTSFYTYCYKTGSPSVCSTASTNAGVVLFATHPDLDDGYGSDDDSAPEEDQYGWRSQGGLFSGPPTLYEPSATSGGVPDYDKRRTAQNQGIPEFINALWYRFDGLNTLAVKQAGSDIRYLPNQVVDAHPTNAGWNGAYDGTCYAAVTPFSCDRSLTNYWSYVCQWDYPV